MAFTRAVPALALPSWLYSKRALDRRLVVLWRPSWAPPFSRRGTCLSPTSAISRAAEHGRQKHTSVVATTTVSKPRTCQSPGERLKRDTFGNGTGHVILAWDADIAGAVSQVEGSSPASRGSCPFTPVLSVSREDLAKLVIHYFALVARRSWNRRGSHWQRPVA